MSALASRACQHGITPARHNLQARHPHSAAIGTERTEASPLPTPVFRRPNSLIITTKKTERTVAEIMPPINPIDLHEADGDD